VGYTGTGSHRPICKPGINGGSLGKDLESFLWFDLTLLEGGVFSLQLGRQEDV